METTPEYFQENLLDLEGKVTQTKKVPPSRVDVLCHQCEPGLKVEVRKISVFTWKSGSLRLTRLIQVFDSEQLSEGEDTRRR